MPPAVTGKTGVISRPGRKPVTKERINRPAGKEVFKVPEQGGNIEQLRVIAVPFRERTAILDEVLVEVNWTEESVQLGSVEADITFKNNGDFAKDILKPGTWLRIQFFDMFHRKWLNLNPPLYVWELTRTDDVTREARVHAFDILSFLHNQDTQDWFFRADKRHKVGWTAYEIAKTVLMDLEVASKLAKTRFKIPWLYMQEHTPFEAILKAYTRDRQITGIRWRIQAGLEKKVNILPFTQQSSVWVIAAGSNLIAAEWGESLNTRKTEVIVLATNQLNNKTRGARATSARVREFGRLREVIYLDKGAQAQQLKAFAREALKWVDRYEQTVRMTSMGLAPLRAGDAVYIEDPKGTGLQGRFFATEITHNFTASSHTMDLTLSDVSIVPALFPTRDELVRGTTSILGVKAAVEGPLGVSWFPPLGSKNFTILNKANQGPHSGGNTWMLKSAVDMKADQGSVVYACFSGTLRGIKTAGTSGHLAGIQVYLDNGNGPTAFYSNLASLVGGLGNSSRVQLGDAIGSTGNAAKFSGLHFALSKEKFGVTTTDAGIDPEKFVNPAVEAPQPTGGVVGGAVAGAQAGAPLSGSGQVLSLRAINQEFTARNLDPVAGAAVSKRESGWRADALGDQGCSYGLFQLNRCGGAINGMSDAEAREFFDPVKCAAFVGDKLVQMGGFTGRVGPEVARDITIRFERPSNKEAKAAEDAAFYPQAKQALEAALRG